MASLGSLEAVTHVASVKSRYARIIINCHVARSLIFASSKCDLGKPNCSKCERAGRVCEGYDRERRFVHTSSNDLQKSWKSVLTVGTVSVAAAANNNNNVNKGNKSHQTRITASRPRKATVKKETRDDNGPKPPHFLNINPAFRTQLLSAFLNAYMPSCPQHSQLVKANFMVELPMQLGRTRALDLAIIALCAVFVGNVYKDEPLHQYGSLLYGRAMKDLRETIQRDNGKAGDDTLYAIAVLQVYEVSLSYPFFFKGYLLRPIVDSTVHAWYAWMECPRARVKSSHPKIL